LNALTRFLVTESSVGDTLLQVAEIAVEALPPARMAGVTLLGETGRPTTAVFTDEDSPAIDQAQYDSGNGPCLDAWRHRQVIVVDDVDKVADEYAEFSAACAEHGVYSTLSLPLVAAGTGLGALNLYAPLRNGFGAEHVDLGQDLAVAAATVLANASAYWTTYEHSLNLAEAMKSRSTIEQAKGMLMANSPHLSPDDAFQILSKASQRENRKVREIAQQIVDRAAPPRPPSV
jgi:transcriptional regulator with GAF, ATPase, and Fis domain